MIYSNLNTFNIGLQQQTDFTFYHPSSVPEVHCLSQGGAKHEHCASSTVIHAAKI
jgi:hypothetical protein